MASNTFLVRQLTTAEEVRLHVTPKMTAGGFKPGALDYASFFASDETGFFVGELDGQVISCFRRKTFSKLCFCRSLHCRQTVPWSGLWAADVENSDGFSKGRLQCRAECTPTC